MEADEDAIINRYPLWLFFLTLEAERVGLITSPIKHSVLVTFDQLLHLFFALLELLWRVVWHQTWHFSWLLILSFASLWRLQFGHLFYLETRFSRWWAWRLLAYQSSGNLRASRLVSRKNLWIRRHNLMWRLRNEGRWQHELGLWLKGFRGGGWWALNHVLLGPLALSWLVELLVTLEIDITVDIVLFAYGTLNVRLIVHTKVH